MALAELAISQYTVNPLNPLTHLIGRGSRLEKVKYNARALYRELLFPAISQWIAGTFNRGLTIVV